MEEILKVYKGMLEETMESELQKNLPFIETIRMTKIVKTF